MIAQRTPQFIPGVKLIEASAGTGKTYRVGQYLLSLVLSTENLAMSSVVVVTFTRAATGELQGRIRDVLRGALLTLQSASGGVKPEPDAPGVAALLACIGASGSQYAAVEDLERLSGPRWPGIHVARQRLERAVRDFDQMVVSTIHGLCHRILAQNALLTGSPVRFDLREQISRDLRQAANDVVARWERDVTPRWSVWGVGSVTESMRVEEQFPQSWFSAASVTLDAPLLATPIPEMVEELDRTCQKAVHALRSALPALVSTVVLPPKGKVGGSVAPQRLFGVSDKGHRVDRDATLALAAWLDSDRPREVAAWTARTKGEGATALTALADGLDGIDLSAIPRWAVPAIFTRALVDSNAEGLAERYASLLATGIPDAVQSVADGHLRLLVAARAQMIMQVRALVDERLAAANAISHNQTIAAVAEALRGPQRDRLIDTLRARFRYAFVDEFQDTDPEQWTLFESVFVHDADNDGALYTVGDPKQAIYSFRGADVATYLDAADTMSRRSGERESLARNWRSAPQHVEAVNVLFHHEIGDSGNSLAARAVRIPDGVVPVVYAREERVEVPVLQAPADGGAVRGIRHDRIEPALKVAPFPEGAPARVEPGIDICFYGSRGVLSPPGAPIVSDPEFGLDLENRSADRAGVAARVALDIAELLASGALLPRVSASESGAVGAAPVAPSDIAVLGSSNQSVIDVYEELLRLGVPATLMRESVVSDSEGCSWLVAMLEVLAHPEGASQRIALADAAPWDVGANGLAALRDPTGDAAARFSKWATELAERAARRGHLLVLREMLDDEGWHQRIFTDHPGAPPPAAKVLARPAGERELADLLQLIEVVDRWIRIERASLDEVRARLATTRTSGGSRYRDKSSRTLRRSRDDDPTLQARLESEASGVRLLTTHKAKGLEFPVVFVLPMPTEPFEPDLLELREHGDLKRVPDVWATVLPSKAAALSGFDIGVDRSWLETARQRARRAAIDEQTRVLYVALTRARIATRWYVAGPAPGKGQDVEPLGATARLLGWWIEPARLPAMQSPGPHDALGWPEGSMAPRKGGPPTVRDVLARTAGVLASRADALARSTGSPLVGGSLLRIHWLIPRPFDDADRVRPALAAALLQIGQGSDADLLRARPWTRGTLAQRWKTWSFSSIKAFARRASPTADDHEWSDADELIALASEALPALAPQADTAEHGGSDEPHEAPPEQGEAGETAAAAALAEDRSELPLAGFPSGTRPGTCLHHVLEQFDFREADLPTAETSLRAVVEASLRRHGLNAARWAESATAGLLGAVRTPIGGPLGAFRLADIPRERRLDELRFSLSIRGGGANQARDAVWRDELAAALLDRDVSPSFPQAWVDTVRSAQFGALGLAGFLTGSIDVVFQPDGDTRWFVADYKSNRVCTDWSRLPQRADFVESALVHEMVHHHYMLQLTLYLVALHRYLRGRVPGYSYESHVGGAYYLFVRGMNRPTPPAGHPRQQSAVAPGVYFDRPPAAQIERLSAILDRAEGAVSREAT